MNEQNIRNDADLRAALTLESCLAEARRMAAQSKLRGQKKRVFIRAARIAAEQQINQRADR